MKKYHFEDIVES